jgi:hypothetical protein
MKTLDSAPKTESVTYRGTRKGSPPAVGETININTPKSFTDSLDVAAHYSKGVMYEIEPGMKYLPVSQTVAAREGKDGGVAAFKQEREKYRGNASNERYFNAELDTDQELFGAGTFKVKSVEQRQVPFENQITGKRTTKNLTVVRLTVLDTD